MTLYLYKIGTNIPVLTIENVISYTADQVVARDTEHGGAEIVYSPMATDCELSATPDCTGTLRADWHAAQKRQDIPLPLRPGISPVAGAANSYRRSADGLVMICVAVTDSGHIADLPEGYRPTATVCSGGITISPDGTVWANGSTTGTICYFA